jgi:hypothetical protein
MTRQRRRLLIGSTVLALLGVLALPGVHWRLVGWWRGEPFWRGRPASYWAAECERIDLRGDFGPANLRGYYVHIDDPSLLAWAKKRLGYEPAWHKMEDGDLPFADADPTALPLLRVLAADRGPASWFAREALERLDPDAPKEAVPDAAGPCRSNP